MASSSSLHASAELRDRVKDKDLIKLHGFVGGQWIEADDGKTVDVSAMTLPKIWTTDNLFLR